MKLTTLGKRTFPELQWEKSTWQWHLELEPYDLVGGWFSSARARITDWQVQLPDGLMDQLAEKLRRVALQVDGLLNRSPLPLLANGDFETSVIGRQIPGWRYKEGDGLTVTVEKDSATGRQALRLRSEGDSLWIRSHPFPPPRTGRLYVLARIKTRAGQQPQLRVVLDDGQNFYYPLLIGGSSTVKIPESWSGNFLFPFEDLPIERLEKLYVGFDLMSSGEVWIDDIQLFDMWISREERSGLMIAIGVANKHLERAANVTDTLHFLESYWPQMLLRYARPSSTPQADAPVAHTAQRDKSMPEKPAGEHRRNRWDQVKEWLPRVPFKIPSRH